MGVDPSLRESSETATTSSASVGKEELKSSDITTQEQHQLQEVSEDTEEDEEEEEV